MSNLEELEEKRKKLELEKKIRNLELQKDITDKVSQTAPAAKKIFKTILILIVVLGIIVVLSDFFL